MSDRTAEAPPRPVLSPRSVPWKVWIAVAVVLGLPLAWLAVRLPLAALALPAGIAVVLWGLHRPIHLFAGFIIYGSIELLLVTRFTGDAYLAVRIGSEVVLVAVSLGVIAGCVIRTGTFRRTPADLPLLAFVAVCVISAMWNHVALVPAVLGVRILLRFALVYYALVQLRPTPDDLRPLFRALLIVVALQVAFGLLQAIDPARVRPLFLTESGGTVLGMNVTAGQSFHEINLHTAIFGSMENYNVYGAFLAVTLLLVFAYWNLRRGHGRFWIGLLLVCGLTAIVLTGSRSSFLALLAGSIAALWRFRYRRTLGVLAAGLVIVLTLMVGVSLQRQGLVRRGIAVYSDNVLNRWLILLEPGTFANRIGKGADFRLILLRKMSTWILTRAPLVGMGIGTFGSAYSMQSMLSMYQELGFAGMVSRRYVADCNWVTLYAQTGVLGLLAFVAVLWRVGRLARRSAMAAIDPAVAAIAEGIGPFLVGVGVAAFFGPHLETKYLSFLLWSFMAVTVCVTVPVGSRAEPPEASADPAPVP